MRERGEEARDGERERQIKGKRENEKEGKEERKRAREGERKMERGYEGRREGERQVQSSVGDWLSGYRTSSSSSVNRKAFILAKI